MPGQSEDSYITIAECLQKYGRSVDDYLNPKWFNCLEHIAVQSAVEYFGTGNYRLNRASYRGVSL